MGAVRSGQVHGFLCESFGTVESIKREDPSQIVSSSGCPQGPSDPQVPRARPPLDDHRHSGRAQPPSRSDQQFEEELNAALAMGMKLLSAPYIGVAIPDRLRNNPQDYAEEVFATARLQRTVRQCRYRHCRERGGGSALAALAKDLTAKLDGPRPPRMAGPGVPLPCL